MAGALLLRVAGAGLDRLQIGDQLGDPRPDRGLIVRLGVETCAPYWHVARAVSLDLGAAVDEAGDLVLGQRIPESLRKPAQVGRRSAQRGRHRTVALASESMARGA